MFGINLLSIQLLACIAFSPVRSLVAPAGYIAGGPVTWSTRIGWNHGANKWNDHYMNDIGPFRLATIELWCGDRLDGLRFNYGKHLNTPAPFLPFAPKAYGYTNGSPTATLHLQSPTGLQYVTTVSAKTVEVAHGPVGNDRTRIGWIKFDTNGNQHAECGKAAHDTGIITWNFPGKALAYTAGTSGAEIDSIMGAFVDIANY